ncbi:hypothetical protein B0H14DRAFT_2563448 [Mycena olivaceomarginata]|nr:hypothetical protein B0H14DRAFT_2563448 [Mycena olivaceomarginata]
MPRVSGDVRGRDSSKARRRKAGAAAGPVGLQERDADMAWLGSTRREAAMWTSASGALGLEQERRDQEETRMYDGCRTVNTTERNCTFPSSFSASSCNFTSNGVECRCRETVWSRCEGASDVDAERDQCIKTYTGAWSRRRRRRDATGVAANGRRAWGGTAAGVVTRRDGHTESRLGRGGTGRAWRDGTGLAGRPRRRAMRGQGLARAVAGGVELAAEDGGRRAWRLGHGRAARANQAQVVRR